MEIKYILVGRLNRFPKNARVHDDGETKARAEAIKVLGFEDPLLVWRKAATYGYPRNAILGGEGRWLSVKYLIETLGVAATARIKNLRARNGEILLPCTFRSCDEKNAVRINFALNAHTGKNDPLVTQENIKYVDDGVVAIDVIGYTRDEADLILADGVREVDETEYTEGRTRKVTCPKCGHSWLD